MHHGFPLADTTNNIINEASTSKIPLPPSIEQDGASLSGLAQGVERSGDLWAGALPAKQGLYNPDDEKDSCGVGFVVHIKGCVDPAHSVFESDCSYAYAQRAVAQDRIRCQISPLQHDPPRCSWC